jgi:hypothetical protein
MKCLFFNPDDILTISNTKKTLLALKNISLITQSTIILPYVTKEPSRFLSLLSKYDVCYKINPNCAIPNRYCNDIETEIIDYISQNDISAYAIIDSFIGYYNILSHYVFLCYNQSGITDLLANEIIDYLNTLLLKYIYHW